MLNQIEIVSGNDLAELLQIQRQGATFNIPVASTVLAVIVSRDRTKLLAGPFPLLSADQGADWSTSLLSLIVDGSELSGLEPARAKIEVKVDDNGNDESWFFDAEIVQGNID